MVWAVCCWGQIHGLGGDGRLARAVAGTRLGTDFEHDDFWITVMQFFIANPTRGLAPHRPVHRLHPSSHRFVPQEVFAAPGVVERSEPGAAEFHHERPHTHVSAAASRGVAPDAGEDGAAESGMAPPSGIAAFEWVVKGSSRGGNLKVWTITELLSTKALVAEGRKMKHCVASYERSCAHGDCSIWTLEVETFEGRSKLLTIEVRTSTRLICQVRGKYNALAAEKHRGVLRRWAEQAGLRMASHV